MRKLNRTATKVATAGVVLASAAAPAMASPGAIDSSFGSAGHATVAVGSTSGAAAVAVQPNGMIVTAGEATVDGQNVIVATRMTSSGTLDRGFGSGGIVTVAINGGAGVDSGDGIALQSDGKIVIAGGGRNGTYGPISFAAVRLNTNGSLDSSFGTGGIATIGIGPYSIANGIVIQPDGKIALAGTAQINGLNQFAAARLNANGTLDRSFGPGGVVTLPQATAAGAWGLALQPDGKLVLGGQENYTDNPDPWVTNAQQFMAARLNTNGTLDASFGRGGIVSLPIGYTSLGFGVAVQPSTGKLILAGPAYTTTGVNATARLNPDGSLDQSYGTGGTATVPDWYGANGIVIDGSDRVVVPTTGAGAVRFTADGTVDSTFGSGGVATAPVGSQSAANGAAIQPNGEIVLAGAATVGNVTEIMVERVGG